MVVLKENMVVLIGLLLCSMKFIKIASAIGSINEGPLGDDINVACSPRNPIAQELDDDANEYAKWYNSINHCESLQDGQKMIQYGDEVRHVIVHTSKNVEEDKNVVHPLPYIV